MAIDWNSFAVGAEISVIANGTLVAVASDIGLASTNGTKRTIAVDAAMDERSSRHIRKSFIERRESMARVDLLGFDNACRAKVPIRTVETLVTDSHNSLV